MGKQIWKDVPGITYWTRKEVEEYYRRQLTDPIRVMHRLRPPEKTPDQTEDAKGAESPESRRPSAPQLPLPIYAPVAWDSSGCTRRAKWLKAFSSWI